MFNRTITPTDVGDFKGAYVVALLTLLLILVVGAAIPAAIAYGAVKITIAERNDDCRGMFKNFVVFVAKIASVLILIGLFVFVWALGAFEGTNVAFQSSDGEWADSEVLYKGRDFEGILFRFELYRTKCSPQAKLQRTTPKPNWYEYNSWFNDYSSPKWYVPYRSALPNAKSDDYPNLSIKHCANHGYSEEEENAAHARAIQAMSSYAP